MSKYNEWWDSLPISTKEYLKNQPIWHDKDLYKVAAIAGIAGFVIGFLVGFEVAWEPVISSFRPMVG